MTTNKLQAEKIKAEAIRLGFTACGIARAEAVDEETARHFRQWILQGRQAEMHYMENHLDKRLDPRLLMEGLKTIVCVALNYTPQHRLPEGEYQIAAYALGKDYHDIVKQKLHQLAHAILPPLPDPPAPPSSPSSPQTPNSKLLTPNSQLLTPHHQHVYRAFSDSAPILERYWAVRAGIGWTGRNRQLIIPPRHSSDDGKQAKGGGSMFFLGELFLDIEADHYDAPIANRCGTCHKCIDACPTGAISDDAANFDASRCLSYQTIENRDGIPQELAAKMGDTIYGCDRCQQACPWNRFSLPTSEPLLQPSPELLGMKRHQWQQLSQEEYRQLFKGSAVKRAKYEGLMRNIHAVERENDTTAV